MTFDASRFESLGGNCEFGFFLVDHGNHATSLLKWAEVIGIDGLTRLIESDFEDLFAFEAIAPFNANMVMDRRYQVAWHSKFEASPEDPTLPIGRTNARFVTPEAERRVLWEDQAGKLRHFVGKLREGLRAGDRIFVYKPRGNDVVTDAALLALSNAIRAHGPATLLAVTVARSKTEVGTVRRRSAGLLLGSIDRIAPGDRTNDYSDAVWTRLCETALRMVDAPSSSAFDGADAPRGDGTGGLLARAATRVRKWTDGFRR